MQIGVTLYLAPSFKEAVQKKEGNWEKKKKKKEEKKKNKTNSF